MFTFKRFPGVDFTQINLDWIMKKIGLLEAGQITVERAAEQATAAAEQATTAAEEATAAAEAATAAVEEVTEQIETVTETANSAEETANSAEETANSALNKFPVAIPDGGTGGTNVAQILSNLGLTIYHTRISATTASTGGIGTNISVDDYIVIAAVPYGNGATYYSLTMGSYNNKYNFSAVMNNANLTAYGNTAISFDVYYISKVNIVERT